MRFPWTTGTMQRVDALSHRTPSASPRLIEGVQTRMSACGVVTAPLPAALHRRGRGSGAYPDTAEMKCLSR